MDPGKSSQLIVNKLVTSFATGGFEALVPYVGQVLEWNQALSLVSRRDPVAACERLLHESVEFGRMLGVDHCRRIADVGSGAGFPGVVWALLHPDSQFTLIERREKRALFLERTCRHLGVTNASVRAGDLRDVSLDEALAGWFDLVVSVAVGDLDVVGALAEPLLGPGGRFASTVSRETPPPERIGMRLRREQHVDGQFGCYVTYRPGV